MKRNILLDKLPQYTSSGLKIRTDFRESIKFELLMQDNKIDEQTKIMQALKLYYYDLSQITDIKQAINDILWFYAGGKKDINIEETKTDNTENKKQIYSYEFDDEYIYSAFMEQYKMDLNSIKYLHWWKFKSLMNGLSENIQFVKIMGYRAIDLSKIKDKDMKANYKKLKKQYALPDMRSEEQKEADFGKAFW